MNNLFNIKILEKNVKKEVDLSKNNLKKRREFLNKWINLLDNGILDKAKEEEFQGEFIDDIFSKVLNAVNKSDGKDKWNVQRETKTKVDGQKADGVIGFFDINNEDIRAVIELKSPQTHLDSKQRRSGDSRTSVEQAFGYAPKYGKNCSWVIVSNYKEIRLYRSNDMTEYHIFYLNDLRDEFEFKKFIYIMSFYALIGDEKHKAKTISLSEEYQKEQKKIEQEFYEEYKSIRIEIFNNLKDKNKQFNEIVLLEKVQKLLDRFLFICFAEDKELLPMNIYANTIKKGKEFGDIYETFKMLCNWINSGSPKYNINYFNGGLFKTDEILDSLTIDNIIFEHLEKFSTYDFDSELNENILGHIFEQSISDLEELKKEITNKEFDKKKSRRKTNGIFYTPKYITKYIVESTIKTWLEAKRKELGEEDLPLLEEKDYLIDISKKRKYTVNYKKHIKFWEKYKECLKNIKILDPACGSGAFLLSAFEFLYNHGNYVNEKIVDLTGTHQMFREDITKDILINNLFGVDLNKESVEITKLSLWLKTANKGKALTTLDDNIKYGNSLIEDSNLVNNNFEWKIEFPQIMKNGGFDIIIGNPPYILYQKENISEEILRYYKKNYIVSQYKIDAYHLFFEKGINLLKENGVLGYITPNTFLTNIYNTKLREFILTNTSILEIAKENAFEEVAVDTSIILLMKTKEKNENIRVTEFKNQQFLEMKTIYLSEILNTPRQTINILKSDKIELKNVFPLLKIAEVYFGIQAFNKKESISNEKLNENYRPMIDGRDIHSQKISKYNLYFNFLKENIKSGGDEKVYLKKRLGVRQIGKIPIVGFINENILTSNTIYNIYMKEAEENYNLYFILGVLNSNFIKSYWTNMYSDDKDLFPKIKGIQLKELPIPMATKSEINDISKISYDILIKNNELEDLDYSFFKIIRENYKVSFNRSVNNLINLEEEKLLKILKKEKISLIKQDEIMIYFYKKQSEIKIKNEEIAKLNIELNDKIEKLYFK